MENDDSRNSSPLRPSRSLDGKKDKEKFKPTEYQVEHYKSVIAKLKVRRLVSTVLLFENDNDESVCKFVSILMNSYAWSLA